MKAAHPPALSPFRGWRRWAWAALALTLALDAALMIRIATEGAPSPSANVSGAAPKGRPAASTDRSRSQNASAPGLAILTEAAAAPIASTAPATAAAARPSDEIDPAALAALVPRELPEALRRVARLPADVRERAMRMLKRRLEGAASERAQLLSLITSLQDDPSLDLLAQILLWRLEIPPSPQLGAEQMFAILKEGGSGPRRRAAAVALRRYCFVRSELEAGRLMDLLRREQDPGVLSELGFALVNRSDSIPGTALDAHEQALENVAARMGAGRDRQRMLSEAWQPREMGSDPDEGALEWLQRTRAKWSLSSAEMREDAAAALAELVGRQSVRSHNERDQENSAVIDAAVAFHLELYRASSSPDTHLELFRSVVDWTTNKGGSGARIRPFLVSAAAAEADPERAQALRRLAEPTAYENPQSPAWSEVRRLFYNYGD